MATSSKGLQAMPGPSSSKAPSFKGELSDLLDFFTDFEDLKTGCGLKNDEMCHALLQYIDSATKWLWVTLAGYESLDYVAFKPKILEQYSGADKGIHYTY